MACILDYSICKGMLYLSKNVGVSYMNKKTTISDISKKTGFSPATISRALNHRHLVNDETYRKIIETMKQSGYKIPSSSSITSDSVDKRILVVNVSDITNSFYAKIFKGIVASANNHGWYVMVNQDPIDQYTLQHFEKMLKSCNAIGLITFDVIERTILDSLIGILPVVQCCEFEPSSKVPYIGIDNFSATVTLIEYLISHNHKKIAIVNGPLNLKSEKERQRGYEFALQCAGIEIDPNFVINLSSSDYFMAHTSVARLLSSSNVPDAIFSVSDVIAYASIMAAKECGLNVPGDLSVIGFDNISLSEMCMPKITTVNHPCFEIGYLGCEMIYKQRVQSLDRFKSTLLNTELILRESSK